MNSPTLLSIVGLSLNALASIILVFTLLLSNKAIDEMSSTHVISRNYGFSPGLNKELKKSKSVARIGLIGLVLGFLCQLASQLWVSMIS